MSDGAPLPRLLVVGGGSIGERHVRCFLRSGRVEVGLCDSSPRVLQAVGNEYALAEAFADFDAALAWRPDIAVVCTPAHLHIPMARRLIEAGTAVLIEKPLSTTLDGVDELLAMERDAELPLAVAYVYRAHPALRAMRDALRSGRFGRPVQCVAVFGQHFPFYRPAYREIYYRDRATGGGAIQDALTHVVNATEWLVGPITELVADAAHQVLAGVTVEDTVHLVARHAEVLASYALNQHQPANEGTITVVCERGMLRFEMHQGRWLWSADPEEPWHEEAAAPPDRDGLFVRQAESFLDAVDGRASPLCNLADAAQTLRVNLAILRSAESRGWETVAASQRQPQTSASAMPEQA